MTRHALCILAIVVSATNAMAQYQPPDITLDPTVTAHCAWGDADCSTPILHGAATACHQDQARCEGQCAQLEGGTTTTWCEGEPYPTPSTPSGDPTAPGCTWHDVEDLQQLSTCVGSPMEVMRCRQQLAQDLHPTCQQCLQANNHNVSACVLDSTPHCLVHDAHDFLEMIACGRLHPNATSQGLQACAAGVLMDMTEGCSTCMRATDNNVSHCMLPFQETKCSPCDVNLLRHVNECHRAGLSNDMCAIDNMLHVSDQCAACLVLRDEENSAIDCMPDSAPGQCLIEDWPAMDSLDACADGDEACYGAAINMLSDGCYGCAMKTNFTDPSLCFSTPHPSDRCRHDTSGDGMVGVDDLLSMLAAYGTSGC